MMNANSLRRLRSELGVIGLAAIALLAGAALFFFFALRPLEGRNAQLERQLALNVRPNSSSDPALIRASAPAAKIAAFYHFLKTDQPPTHWLDRLYAAGQTAGVELRAADYRMQKTGTRIERYEIKLPVSGNYAQIRAFLQNALTEIPVLSLDEVKFKKERASDQSVQAELRLTLHLINP
jgi:Tfp pilus assembly protein PilN